MGPLSREEETEESRVRATVLSLGLTRPLDEDTTPHATKMVATLVLGTLNADTKASARTMEVTLVLA